VFLGVQKNKKVPHNKKKKQEEEKILTKTTQTKKLSLPRGSLEFPSLKRSRARS
jgi:hypothetical protein